MMKKKHRTRCFRKNTYRKNTRRKHTRIKHIRRKHTRRKHKSKGKLQRGGGCLDIYPLSSCGGAVGRCDPYVGSADQYGGWRIKDVSGRKSAERSRKKKHKSFSRKAHNIKTRRLRGGSTRDPIIGAELQQGLYSILNTGKKAINTWNGVKSPFSLDASPLNQPVDMS